jgi:hypothetical protein
MRFGPDPAFASDRQERDREIRHCVTEEGEEEEGERTIRR